MLAGDLECTESYNGAKQWNMGRKGRWATYPRVRRDLYEPS